MYLLNEANTLSKKDFPFLCGSAAVVVAELAIRADDAMTGNRRIEIRFKYRTYRSKGAGRAGPLSDFLVAKHASSGDFFHYGKDFLFKCLHLLVIPAEAGI